MTHSPPVPPGNQSPYPLQEAPHEHHAALPPDVAARRTQQDEPMVSGAALGIGLAIGLGSAALFAAWFFSGGEKAKPKSKPAAQKRQAQAGGNAARTKDTSRGAGTRSGAPSPRRRKTTNDNN